MRSQPQTPTPLPFPSWPLPRQRRFSRRLFSSLLAAAVVLAIGVLVTAVLFSHFQNTPVPTPGKQGTTTSAATSGTTAAATAVSFMIYFPKSTDSTLQNVYPVQRLAASTTDIEAFSIMLLIAGPTPSERSQGYFSELNGLFSGPPSGCNGSNPTVGGPDFTLNLNMKGATPEQGTATLQFCHPTSSPGIGADARVSSQINATLKQFSSIKKVVILDESGHCFADLKGSDDCLK